MVVRKACCIELWATLNCKAIGRNIAGTEYLKIVSKVSSINQCFATSKSIFFFSKDTADGIVVCDLFKAGKYTFKIDENTSKITVVSWSVS